MKLLILSQYFPPEMGAPQARLSELAWRLQDRGHVVTVLTAMPNYPTGKVFRPYRWRLRTEEKMKGLRVIRTWIWPSNSDRALPRLASYASYALSSLLLGTWGLGRQDLVLVESPPLFLVPSGLIIGRITGARVVVNLADIWPDVLVRMGKASKGPFLTAMCWLEKFGYEHADAVTTTNPGATRQIRERFPQINVGMISNGVDRTLFSPCLRSESVRRRLGASSGDLLVGYFGLHGVAQGLEVVLGAAERLQDRPNIKFVLVGDGPLKAKLVAMAKEKSLRNLLFLDPVPKPQVPAMLASCDASLVPLAARLPGTMPSKVYEAMAAGTPPVVAKGCEAEALLKAFDAGKTFEPMDGQELAGALLELADRPEEYRRIRDNALALAARFDRDVIADRTEGVLQAVAQRRPLPETAW